MYQKVIFLFIIIIAVCHASAMNVVGGINPIEDENKHNDAVKVLTQNIAKLEAGNWEIIEIERSAQQVVAGIKYYLYGTFKDNNDNLLYKGTVTIYSRPWEDFIELSMQDKVKVE